MRGALFRLGQAAALPIKTTMINELLDLLLPQRTSEGDVETFRRGLVRLMADRASDDDSINRRLASASQFAPTTSTSS
jgi:hypothetical protein